ncbi:MAG: hypothetical protein AAGA75_23650 [Cyanobacteria bacterium P01_E01_bin.6]
MKFIKRAIKNNYQKFIVSLIAGTVKEKFLKDRDENFNVFVRKISTVEENATQAHTELSYSVRRLEVKIDAITRAMASINQQHGFEADEK